MIGGATAQVELCFNYGCKTQARVAYSEADLAEVGAMLAEAKSASEERALLAKVVGRLYIEAGRQSPIHSDRRGNFADAGVFGKMDCIDHSTSTMRLLRMLEARGLLRYHKVVPRARRTTLVLFQHFSAVIEETAARTERVSPVPVPDHVPVLMALCDCPDLAADRPKAPAPSVSGSGEKFVVDSWFVEQGEPAVVLPLAEWLDGGGPNVP